MKENSKKFKLWEYNSVLEGMNGGEAHTFGVAPIDTTMFDPDIIVLGEIDIICPPIPTEEESARQSLAKLDAYEDKVRADAVVLLEDIETKRAKRRAIASEEGGNNDE